MNRFPYHVAGHSDGWWFLWGIVPIVLLAGLMAAVVVMLLRSRDRVPAVAAGSRSFPAVPRDPALDALRLRYARGEVERDVYLSAAADLATPGGDAAASPAPEVPARGDPGPSATDAPT